MAFAVTPTTADAGVLDPGEVVLIPVTFSDVPADTTGQGVVTFDLGGQSATVTVSITVDNAGDVTVGSVVLDPAFTDVSISVQNLTNAGATIRVARG